MNGITAICHTTIFEENKSVMLKRVSGWNFAFLTRAFHCTIY